MATAVGHEPVVIGLDSRTDDDLLAERRPRVAGAAFAVFYERHERAVLAHFMRRVRAADLAADLAAETFAQALASRHRYRPQKAGSAIARLFGIAGHVLARSARRARVEDRARRRLGLPALVLDDDALEAIERLSGDVEATLALERLPAVQREAIRAHVVDEHSYAEIAARLRCSQAVIRKRVSRGLGELRRALEESS